MTMPAATRPMAVKLEDVLAFVETVQRQSLSKAATALALNQPAITRRIQNLEEALNTALLDRQTRPLRPTAAGWRVFEKCQSLLAQLQELYEVGTQTAPRESLRLGLAHALAQIGISRLLQTFEHSQSQFEVRLTAGWGADLLDQVARGTLDAAVVATSAPTFPIGVQAQPLMAFEVVVIAPRTQHFPDGSLKLRDIAHWRWITNPDGCGFRSHLEAAMHQIGLSLQVAVDTFGTEAQLELVAQGLGLGLAPRAFVRTSRFNDHLQILSIEDFQLTLNLYMLSNERSVAIGDALQALGDSIVTELSGTDIDIRALQAQCAVPAATSQQAAQLR